MDTCYEPPEIYGQENFFNGSCLQIMNNLLFHTGKLLLNLLVNFDLGSGERSEVGGILLGGECKVLIYMHFTCNCFPEIYLLN